MASETKRGTANKVPIALPKADTTQTSNASLTSLDVSLQMAVGSRARITTAQPNQTTIEGTIYTADPVTNLLVINTSATSQANSISPHTLAAPAGAYRLIPISQISSFQLLTLASPTNSADSPTAASTQTQAPTVQLDTTALNTRLQRSVAAAQASLLTRGPKGTTTVDQALFDGLSRLYPTRWQGTSIVISDSFIVEKPYDSRNVKLLPGAHGDVDRVRKVVERQKTNAALRQPIDMKTTPTAPVSATAGNGVSKIAAGDSQRKGG